MGPIDSADEENNGSLLSPDAYSTARSLSRNEDDPGRLKDAPTSAVPVHFIAVDSSFVGVPQPLPPPTAICGHFLAGSHDSRPFKSCSYFCLQYEPPLAGEHNAARGSYHTESSTKVASPLARVAEDAASSHPEAAASPSFAMSSTVVDSDFGRERWHADSLHARQDLFKNSILIYLRYEPPPPAQDAPRYEPPPPALDTPRYEPPPSTQDAPRYEPPPPAQDAPRRGGRHVEPAIVVPPPSARKGPRAEEGAAPPCVFPVSKAVVPVGFWRAPWGADLLRGKIDVFSEDASLPLPPVAVSGHVAQVKDLDVNPGMTNFPLMGSLAACALALLVLVCRRGFQRRRDRRAAVILHALGRGGLVRFRIRRSATAAAMAAIASCDVVRQCANAPEAGKGSAGPVPPKKTGTGMSTAPVPPQMKVPAAGGAQRSAAVPQVGKQLASVRHRVYPAKTSIVEAPNACMTPASGGSSLPTRQGPSPPPSPPTTKVSATVDGSALVEDPSLHAQAASVFLPSVDSSSPPHRCSPPLSPPSPPSPVPPKAKETTAVKSKTTNDSATEQTSKPGRRQRKLPKEISAAEVAAVQALKLKRESRREGRRQARQAAKRGPGLKTAKGTCAESTEPPKGTPGSTNSGSFPSSTPVGVADNMARSGCDATGAASGSVRRSGMPGPTTWGKASSSTSSVAASVAKARISTWENVLKTKSVAVGVQRAGPSTSGGVSSTKSGAAVAQKARGTGKGLFSWSPSETPPCPAGLSNKGNRCAINTAVHVIRNDAALRKALMGIGGDPPTEGTLGAHMGKMFKRMEEKGGKCFVHPSVVANITRVFELTGSRQADAGEILLYVLDILERDASEAGNMTVKAALKRMTGDTHYIGHCSCDRETWSSDQFTLLPVPMEQPASQRGSGDCAPTVKGGTVHLTDLLKKVFSTQMVETCEDCREANGGKSKPGAKSRSPVLAVSPERMMLQLGRYSGDGGVERKKLTHVVTVPTVLDVGSFTPAGRVSEVEVLYDLEVVVHHTSRDRQQGDVEQQRGHYKVFTRVSDDIWYKCDDLVVSTVNTSEVLSQDAYILSYAKRR